MAKQTKTSSGPVTTQRERKTAKVATNNGQEEGVEGTSEEHQTQPVTPRTEIPQEQFIRWVGHFANNHVSNDRVVQVGCLSFAILQAYVKFSEVERTDDELGLVFSGIAGLLAFLSALVIAHRVKVKSSEPNSPPIRMPHWNNIYLGFLPSILAYCLNQDLLAYNVAFTTTVVDLPFMVQIMTQSTLITYNSTHHDGIFNLKATLLHYAINYFLRQVTHLKSLDKVEVNLFSILITDLYLIKSEETYVIILQSLGVSFAVGIVVTFLLTIGIQTNNLARTLFILSAWIGSFSYTTFYLLNPILGENALTWIHKFATASQERQTILCVWLGSLLLLIPTIFNYKVSLSPNFRRKIWHFLVLGLIVYPLYIDPEFVKVSLSGSLILFLLVEQLRYLRLAPFGEYLDASLRTFADFRDERGPVIFSYIYLMIGISFPILVNDSVVGLVALGVGDSLASIIGSNYGLIHWQGSKKTIEGTMTFVLATYGVCAFLKVIGWFFQDKSFHSLLVTCVLSGVLEGNSDLNDNILIPAYMSTLLEFLD